MGRGVVVSEPMEVLMSLTLGIGPLSRRAEAGQANATFDGPAHLLWFHEVPKRVRATFGGEVVVDTEGAHLLHETRMLPVYYLPRDDVRFDLLEPTDHSTHCPFKGDARYWNVRVGDHVAENAVWGYDEPIEGAPDLAPYVAFYFDRMDRWYEEDVEIIGHARDPFHRIDVRAASRHVTVRVDGEVVAEADDPVLLFETSLPTRYYLRAESWRSELLEPSERTTICPYKGVAEYRSLRSPAGGEVLEGLVWSYPDPFEEALGVTGRLCIDQDHDRVEVEVTRGGSTLPEQG